MSAWFLLLPILIPSAAALVLSSTKLRTGTELAFCVGTIVTANSILTLLIAWCAPAGALPLLRLSSTLAFALRLDGLGMLFSVLVSVLWVPTTFYALEYMKHEGREKAFFSWFILTYGVVLGIAFSANLLTLYFFYELMTLTTLPLVMHAMDDRAKSAGRKYLIYSVGGAACAFIALVFTTGHGAGASFAMGGNLDTTIAAVPRNTLLTVYLLGFQIGRAHV